MVLNNYWKAMNILKSINGDGADDMTFGMVDVNGTFPEVLRKSNESYKYRGIISNINLRNDKISARVGSGTGTITPTDYALFNDVTSSISNLQVSSTCDATNNGYRQVITISGTNSGESAITITEVGITKVFYKAVNEDVLTNPVMFAKILLDEPIEVAAGGAFSFTIEWLEA
jgi:hypothetical protein